jgi:hypothetical protein
MVCLFGRTGKIMKIYLCNYELCFMLYPLFDEMIHNEQIFFPIFLLREACKPLHHLKPVAVGSLHRQNKARLFHSELTYYYTLNTIANRLFHSCGYHY